MDFNCLMLYEYNESTELHSWLSNNCTELSCGVKISSPVVLSTGKCEEVTVLVLEPEEVFWKVVGCDTNEITAWKPFEKSTLEK